ALQRAAVEHGAAEGAAERAPDAIGEIADAPQFHRDVAQFRLKLFGKRPLSHRIPLGRETPASAPPWFRAPADCCAGRSAPRRRSPVRAASAPRSSAN